MTDRRRKLGEGQAGEIIEIYAAAGATYWQVAARYGVTAQTISDIIRRKKWTRVNAPSAAEMQALMPRARGKARALEIIDRYAAGGVTQAELAAEYDLGLSTINRIIRCSRAATAGAVPHR